jgi:hypothetical protein
VSRSFYSALKEQLERVDADNWESKLDALHGRHRTWQATADALGVDKRTVERWRKGYQPRVKRDGTRPPRQRVDPRTFAGKIGDALGKDRHAQVAAVDWRKLVITGEIGFPPPPPYSYRRDEVMYVGKYLSPAAFEGLAAAYVSAERWRVQRSINNAISVDYLGFAADLISVEDDHGVTF